MEPSTCLANHLMTMSKRHADAYPYEWSCAIRLSASFVIPDSTLTWPGHTIRPARSLLALSRRLSTGINVSIHQNRRLLRLLPRPLRKFYFPRHAPNSSWQPFLLQLVVVESCLGVPMAPYLRVFWSPMLFMTWLYHEHLIRRNISLLTGNLRHLSESLPRGCHTL